MASPTDVKNYLAHWFQLGKQVVSDDGRVSYGPNKVIQGDRFCPEFEDCWRKILAAEGKALYLKGTDQTIQQLLSPDWEVVNCARCDMPKPMPEIEITPHQCPCADLPSWPNNEIPRPRLPIDNYRHLHQMVEKMESQSDS